MPPAPAQPRSAVSRALHAGTWFIRAALLTAYLAAFLLIVGLEVVVFPEPGQVPFAALHALAAIALLLAVTLIAVARHRLELGWPGLLIAAAVFMQAGAAFLYVPPTQPGAITPAAPPLSIQTPGAAGFGMPIATAACFVLLLLHASWVLTPSESHAPLRARLRAWGRTLRFNPVSLLFGPVFQKEVRVAGRRRTTYVARAVYPLVLLGIVGFAYLGMTDDLRHYAGAERLQRLQSLAPALAMVIAWCQFAVLTFLAPVLTAPGICDERRQLTLSALMTTPMTSSQIIFGKLTSRLVIILILALVSTPLLLAVRIYGGLEAEIIIATTSISLSAAVLGASLGLLYSVWHRRAATAAIFGLLSMLVIMLAVIVAVIVIGMRTNLPPSGWILGLSAPMAMFGVTMALMEPSGILSSDEFLRQVWVTSTAVNLALSAFTCAAATLALRSVLRAEAAGALTVHDRPRRRRRRRSAPVPAAAAGSPTDPTDPDAPAEAAADTQAEDDEAYRTGAIRAVGDHPVLWREVRQASFGSRRRLIIVAVAVALAAAFIYSRVPLRDEALHGMIAMIGLFIVILQACTASSASIAGEFESRTWQVLLTTPLSGREIIAGKLLGGLRRQWFVPACIAAHFALGLASGYIHPFGALHYAMIVVSVVVMLTGTGLLLSLLLRRSTGAAVANILLAAGLWFVLPVGTMFMTEIFRGDGFDDVAAAWMAINPFALAVIALEPTVGDSQRIGGSLNPYDFPNGDVDFATFTTILAVACAAAIAVGLASAHVATRLFRKVGGRSS